MVLFDCDCDCVLSANRWLDVFISVLVAGGGFVCWVWWFCGLIGC